MMAGTSMHAFLQLGWVLTSLAIPPVARALHDPNEERALAAFHTRVAAYAALHEALALRVPQREVTGDPAAIARSRDALAAALIAERPTARAGDIFTEDVAAVLQRRLNAALAQHDVWRLLAELNAEHPQAALVRPQVDNRFPTGMFFYEVPPPLLAALPPLPRRLVYRRAYTYLLLWDEHADLIVDVLPDAIAPALSARVVP